MTEPKSGFYEVSPMATLATPRQVRCAVRFPLHLPVILTTEDGEHVAHTVNVSASGVLFESDLVVRLGREIGFSLCMPGAILGTSRDVMVHCRGRVVRCTLGKTRSHIAATIDEYKFAEQ